MGNILIFRSAKHPIVKNCIQYIKNENEDCKVFVCVQEECMEQYNSISNVQMIVFPNGFFEYKRTKSNEALCRILCSQEYDQVYIPYSTVVPNCIEIEKIVFKLVHSKSVFYYDAFGSVQLKNIEINKTMILNKCKKYGKYLIQIVELLVLKLIYCIICVVRFGRGE